MRIAAMRQKTAFTLFSIANLFDHAHAIVALALMRTLGFGVKQDLSRALNFWDRLGPEIAVQGLEIGRRLLEDGRIGSPEANAALDQTMDEALDLLDLFEPDPESGRRVPVKDLPGLLIAAREKGERDFVRFVARGTKTLLPDLPSACAFLKAQVNGQEHEGFCTEEWLTHLNWKDIETKHARVSAQKKAAFDMGLRLNAVSHMVHAAWREREDACRILRLVAWQIAHDFRLTEHNPDTSVKA